MNNIETMKLALEALKCLLAGNSTAHQVGNAITSLRQAIERAQQQEPRQEAQIVNWNCPCGNTVTFRGFTQAPPPRKPLTDEEIVLIVAECAASHQHTDIHFAKAIEAKLKEKNT